MVASFQQVLPQVFVVTLENACHFKAKKKSIGSSKNGTRDFQSSPPFERSASFYEKISRNFERFLYYNIEKHFLENEKHKQKTGEPFFSRKY